MRGSLGAGIVWRMTLSTLYPILLAVHIAAGAIAFAVFWLPLVTKKGGRIHRRVGWVYAVAAAVVATTGLVACAKLAFDGRWRAGAFLAYVGLLAGESALLGVRALRRRSPSARGADGAGGAHRAIDLAPAAALVIAGLGVAALGFHEARVLYVLFATLGVAQGVAHVRYWIARGRAIASSGDARARVLAHMGAMGTSCITTLTAFVVANAQRIGLRAFDPRLWLVPIVVFGVGLTLWRRSYAKRLMAAPPRA